MAQRSPPAAAGPADEILLLQHPRPQLLQAKAAQRVLPGHPLLLPLSAVQVLPLPHRLPVLLLLLVRQHL
jgi:hypothetical protein